jgi:hypothetical protein
MREKQTVVVFYADEPNYELARQVVKKIEGIDCLPLSQEELDIFFISHFDNWQSPNLNSAISKHVLEELSLRERDCPKAPDSEIADLPNQRCHYILRIKPNKKDAGNSIDLFSLNDAFLFWQYLEKLLSNNDDTISDSKVTVVLDLFDSKQGEYFRISKYFQLTILYYGATLYNSFFAYGHSLPHTKKRAGLQRLQQPWKKGADNKADSIVDLFPLIPIDQEVFKVLDEALKDFTGIETDGVNSEQDFKEYANEKSRVARKELETISEQLAKSLEKQRSDKKKLTEPLFRQPHNPQHAANSIVNAILTLFDGFANRTVRLVNLVPQFPRLLESSLLKLLFLQFYLSKLHEIDDLTTLMESCEIPADALRQLLENIINHSSAKVGILSLRCYDKSELPKYRFEQDYSLGVDKLEDDRFDRFVEIIIRDASEQGIPDTFIAQTQNFDLEVDAGSQSELNELIAKPIWRDLKTYLCIPSKSADTRNDYHESISAWKDYYRNRQSAAYHRGISVFLSSIRVANGLFYVSSFGSTKGTANPTIQRLVYHDANIYETPSSGTKAAILGTSYGIIYPIKIPSSEFFQLIDVRQNQRVRSDAYRHLRISAKRDLNLADYRDRPILGQKEKYRFGVDAFNGLQTLLKIKLDETTQYELGMRTILDIRFDYDDDYASTKNDALIKHIGRLYQDSSIIMDSKKTALAIGCRTANDVYSVIQTLYQTWETFAEDEQFNGAETFIYDFTSGLNQALWYGNNIHDVLAVDGSRTVQFGGESLLQVVIGNPDSIVPDTVNACAPTGQLRLAITTGKKLTPFPLLLHLNEPGDFDAMATIDEGIYPPTLFEASLSHILYRDIANPNRQGYRLSDVHFRIGSKIHISDFYQAFPLFHNGYYVNGFGNLLADRIINDCIGLNKENELIMLIGYAGYSELITGRAAQYIEETIADIKIDYLIYEPSRIGQEPKKKEEWLFRRLRRLKQDYEKKGQRLSDFSRILIYQIVPISSTCTTVSKTGDAILRVLDEEKVEAAVIRKSFVPVWVRDNGPSNLLSTQEKVFFKELDVSRRQVATKQPLPMGNRGTVYDVDYLISATTKWYKATDCKLCFPESSPSNEKPLIETDKSSVVPFAQFGIRRKARMEDTDNAGCVADPEQYRSLFPSQEENEVRLIKSLFPKEDDKSFASFVFYGHRERSVNHYQYYLNTERILANLIANDNKEFKDWTDDLKKHIHETHHSNETAEHDIYDIIVSPLHSTNSGFLDYIAIHVFENNALIMNAEFEKDYKDNFEAKYNYLRKQINDQRKLRSSKNTVVAQKLIINVYYVNDTLNHTGDFYRTKELIVSLFKPDNGRQTPNVEVDIFHGVILLANRLSKSSKLAFIDHNNNSLQKPRFFSFFDLAISNMRNYEDACTLCSWNETAKLFESHSSTNDVARHWKEKRSDTQVKRATAIDWNDVVYLKTDTARKDEKKTELLIRVKGIRKSYYRTMVAHRSQRLNESNETKTSITNIQELISEAAGDPYDAGDIPNSKSLLLNKTGFIYCNPDNGRERYQEERMLLLISFIRVLSRPFPSFRIATKNAIFEMIVELLVELITNGDGICSTAEQGWTPKRIVKEYIDFFRELTTDEKHSERITPARIVYILMGRLTSMGSTFLLQEGVFKKLYRFLEQNNFEDNAESIKKEYSFTSFQRMFLINVKRVFEIMGDDSKCLWLEKKLAEYIRQSKHYFSFDTGNNDKKICIDLPIYIENTRILREGIAELDAIRIRDGEEEIKGLPSPNTIDGWLRKVRGLKYFPYLESGERNESNLYFLDNFTEFLEAGLIGKDELPETVSSMVGLKALLDTEKPHDIGSKSLYTMACYFLCRITRATRVDMYVLGRKKTNGWLVRQAQYAWFAGSQSIATRADQEPSPPVADRFLAALRDGTVDEKEKWEWDSYCINPFGSSKQKAKSEPDDVIYLKFLINSEEAVIMRLSFDSDMDFDPKYFIDNRPVRFASAIRSVLMYRQALTNCLTADCENDYFETVRMNRILSDLNTHTHTDSDFLSGIWAAISKWSNTVFDTWAPEPDAFLRLLINHYIGDIRIAGLLPETSSQNRGKHPLMFSKYSRSKLLEDDTSTFIEVLANNNDFTLYDKNSEKISKWNDFVNSIQNSIRVSNGNGVVLYVRDNKQGEHFPWQTYVVIILQVLLDSIKAHKKWSQGATKVTVDICPHAKSDDSPTQNSDIFDLCIETELEEESFAELKDSLIDIENRENGVSLVAVYNAIKRLVGNGFSVQEFISLQNPKEPGEPFSCKFNLPILEGLLVNKSKGEDNGTHRTYNH